jgi:hypothetical protein
MRCRHLKCEVIEETKGYLAWAVEGGTVTKDYASRGDVNGHIRVHCLDCGLRRSFGPQAKYPRWVKDYLAVIWNTQN